MCICTKIKTLSKKQDNLLYVLYPKSQTLYITLFFMELLEFVEEGGGYMPKNVLCITFLYAKNNALCVTFLYKKP